jgi:hypothetical protein
VKEIARGHAHFAQFLAFQITYGGEIAEGGIARVHGEGLLVEPLLTRGQAGEVFRRATLQLPSGGADLFLQQGESRRLFLRSHAIRGRL